MEVKPSQPAHAAARRLFAACDEPPFERDWPSMVAGVPSQNEGQGRALARGRRRGTRDSVAVGVSLSAVLHGVMLAAATSLHATENRRLAEDATVVVRRQPIVVELQVRERAGTPAPTVASSLADEKGGSRQPVNRHLGSRSKARSVLIPVAPKTAPEVAPSVASSEAPKVASKVAPEAAPMLAPSAPSLAAPASDESSASVAAPVAGAGAGAAGKNGNAGGEGRGRACCGEGVGTSGGGGLAVTGRFPARPLANPRPVYPRQARLMGWEGTVVLRLLIDGLGNVTQATVVAGSGYPVLDESAVDAARRWRFSPALDGGRPVAMVHEVRIRFRLDDPAA